MLHEHWEREKRVKRLCERPALIVRVIVRVISCDSKAHELVETELSPIYTRLKHAEMVQTSLRLFLL